METQFPKADDDYYLHIPRLSPSDVGNLMPSALLGNNYTHKLLSECVSEGFLLVYAIGLNTW